MAVFLLLKVGKSGLKIIILLIAAGDAYQIVTEGGENLLRAFRERKVQPWHLCSRNAPKNVRADAKLSLAGQ